ncbi:MAG: hypothetical protein AMS15_03705 [Planctomycetes bacterium DG_23]|nr:MAG: hypothetical protein AMS15_03705 [Planctomycetes bacterium DG_23]
MSRQELIEAYRGLRTADVCDALDELNLRDVCMMSDEIKSIVPGKSCAGPALTVRHMPARVTVGHMSPEEYREFMSYWYREKMRNREIKEKVRPGDILVVDDGASKVSLWGSAISMNMTIAGIAGVVINGGARDTAELRIQGLPTFVRYTMRETCIARMELESINSVINCGDVKVEPEDFIVADDDGVLVVPRDVAEEAARLARGTLDSDKKGRRKSYEALGYEIDETVT